MGYTSQRGGYTLTKQQLAVVPLCRTVCLSTGLKMLTFFNCTVRCLFLHDENLMGISLPQAYIHTRMRAKTSDFLKVLNRARPDAEKKEMKTIS